MRPRGVSVRVKLDAYLFVEVCASVSMGGFEVGNEFRNQLIIAIANLLQQQVSVAAVCTRIAR